MLAASKSNRAIPGPLQINGRLSAAAEPPRIEKTAKLSRYRTITSCVEVAQMQPPNDGQRFCVRGTVSTVSEGLSKARTEACASRERVVDAREKRCRREKRYVDERKDMSTTIRCARDDDLNKGSQLSTHVEC